jgi:hypothetical protein
MQGTVRKPWRLRAPPWPPILGWPCLPEASVCLGFGGTECDVYPSHWRSRNEWDRPVSCSGAPTGGICSVPATVAFNSTAPTNFMVSVSTIARSSWLFPRSFKSVPWLWALALADGLTLLCSSMSRQLHWARLRFVPLAAVLIYGCGGGPPRRKIRMARKPELTP